MKEPNELDILFGDSVFDEEATEIPEEEGDNDDE
jgi:hypothetical protein